ncbi:hypothetical protein FNY66_05145 [Mediterraneibacter catenae]|mgnify:FL=1|uniref:HTH tetR-type domain-containing protein n=2 Tax=Mediterraneibacter TaxID=2316020 RepID=A0A5M9HZK0_9FIRM|nr:MULTISPECIES: TetR/AcrR family transcriptional regulator C-terminal domain-containing protein [Mediterraneibacter]KAA8502127.1 hypothetical protein FNY66_05145 [Mediterraneibacter catenae]MDN0062109.1 TetR/AcrR family transcriptional regulator C-terminal domain-containing protein [Mediterraneibacter glycyrrhizinilyticus]HJC34959.1 TetR/AcrR family transcriptional regulator C-terminal domain-containing protein [Candidatus Mediterraneibacter faecipullorum]
MREDMKAVIADTFTEMLDKEDIDKITVTKLIGECHISRQTFYYHFKDIMDVLDWAFRRATEELVKRSLEAEDNIVALKEFASFIRQNRTKLERLLYSRRWVEIENMLTESAAAYLAEIARNKAPDISLTYDDMEIMLKFYACGMVGVLMHYMGKPHLDEEKLIIQMEKIITGKMFPGKNN